MRQESIVLSLVGCVDQRLTSNLHAVAKLLYMYSPQQPIDALLQHYFEIM